MLMAATVGVALSLAAGNVVSRTWDAQTRPAGK
jgi:hypothetical protein